MLDVDQAVAEWLMMEKKAAAWDRLYSLLVNTGQLPAVAVLMGELVSADAPTPP